MRRRLWAWAFLAVLAILLQLVPLDAFGQRRGGGTGGGRGGFSTGGRSSGGSRGGSGGWSGGGGGWGGWGGGGGWGMPRIWFFPSFGFGSFGSSCCCMLAGLALLLIVLSRAQSSRQRVGGDLFGAAYEEPAFEPWDVAVAILRLRRPEFYVPVMRNAIDDKDFADVGARSRTLQEVSRAIAWDDLADTSGWVTRQQMDADAAGILAERLNQQIIQDLEMRTTLVNLASPESGTVSYEQAPEGFSYVPPEAQCLLTIAVAHRSNELRGTTSGTDAARRLWDKWRDMRPDDCAGLYVTFTPDPGETLEANAAAILFGTMARSIDDMLGG